MASIVKVAATEKAEFKEVSTNEDGFLCISELRKHFPNCVGIRYRVKPQGVLRATLITGDQLHLPVGVSWQDYIFHCVFQDSQKSAVDSSQSDAPLELETFEMIVLGLPCDLTESEFRRYFSTFGQLKICTLKSKRRDSRFNTYGFLRYEHYLDHNQCMMTDHFIKGANVVLRLPSSKMNRSRCNRQLFITNITPSVRLEDIIEYFSCFGKIEQVFMPPVATPYAFLTYESKDCVSRVLRFGKSHRVFGGYVLIEEVYTKREMDMGVKDEVTSEIDGNMSDEDSREDLDYSEQECSQNNQYAEEMSTYETNEHSDLQQTDEEYGLQQKEPLEKQNNGQYHPHTQQWEPHQLNSCQNNQRTENGQLDLYNSSYKALNVQAGQHEQHAKHLLELQQRIPYEQQQREQFELQQREKFELQQRNPYEQQQREPIELQQQRYRYEQQQREQFQPQQRNHFEPYQLELQQREQLEHHQIRQSYEQSQPQMVIPKPDLFVDPYRPLYPIAPSSAYNQPAMAFQPPNAAMMGPGPNTSYHFHENPGRDHIGLVHKYPVHSLPSPLLSGFDGHSVTSSPASQRDCPPRSSSGGDFKTPGSSQLISDIANSILEKVTVQKEEVLVRMLVDQLSSRKRHVEIPGPCAPESSGSSPSKMTRAIQLLQNPKVLDSLIRLSDNIEFNEKPGGGSSSNFPGYHDDA